MKNAIIYYYNLKPVEIHQINKKYKFNTINKRYILYPYKRNYNEIEEIYKLHYYIRALGRYCHKIILNNNNQIITNINSIPYVLLETEIEDRNITLEDIDNLSNIKIDTDAFKKINRNTWYDLWQKKIDYIEYQISQFRKKYPLIRESSDYYIGIVENCITLLSTINEKTTYKSIGHNRVDDKYKTDDFYNPLNLIIDHRCRDTGEFLKNSTSQINNIEDTIYRIIEHNKYNKEEIKLLFIRLIYPSNYIDICEQVLEKNKKEIEISKIINKTKEFEKNIEEIYYFFSTLIPLQDIEWLKKGY